MRRLMRGLGWEKMQRVPASKYQLSFDKAGDQHRPDPLSNLRDEMRFLLNCLMDVAVGLVAVMVMLGMLVGLLEFNDWMYANYPAQRGTAWAIFVSVVIFGVLGVIGASVRKPE